jgi:cell fate (sporulation/competence/biofilm development) regulator YlbF (YheA/YmcA/DUF963 family)
MSNLIVDAPSIGHQVKIHETLQVLAKALRATPTYQRYDKACMELDQDKTAQWAIEAYQAKQQSLRALIMLNALSAKDQTELKTLEQAVYNNKSITDYMEAQSGE